MLTGGALGLTLLCCTRVLGDEKQRSASSGPIAATRFAADALLGLSFICSSMMCGSLLLMSKAAWTSVRLLGLISVMTLLAGFVSGNASRRRGYIVMTIVNAAICFITISVMSHLSGWQKTELGLGKRWSGAADGRPHRLVSRAGAGE